MLVLEDWSDQVDEIAQLHANTHAFHADRGDLGVPIPIGRDFFAAVSSLERGKRWMIVTRVEGRMATFSTLLLSGSTLFTKIAGLDYQLARGSHAYFHMTYSLINFAYDRGASAVDLGTTTYDFKESLGAQMHPTEYHLRFNRWFMRPLSAALRWHFGRQA